LLGFKNLAGLNWGFREAILRIVRIRIYRIQGFSELKKLSQYRAFILINSDNSVNPDSDNIYPELRLT